MKPSDSATASARDFAPDPALGVRLDQAVREGLAASLSILFETLAASCVIDAGRAGVLLRRIEAGRASPGLFGAYVELVVAAFEDRADAVKALVDEILADPPPRTEGVSVVTLDDAELGPGQADRYRRLLRDDIDAPMGPVPAAGRARAEAALGAGLALLESGAPDVFGELSALVGQIVLVSGQESPDGVEFGGASTFSLWGAIALNAERLDDRLDGAMMLAHEAAHCHLFGLALGGRLVENDDEERHPSPLRQDSRPLEGVAHATFVTARMVHTLRALLASGVLAPAEAARARERIVRNQAAYDHGLATVLANARFTPAGAAAFEALRRYMDAPDPDGGR